MFYTIVEVSAARLPRYRRDRIKSKLPQIPPSDAAVKNNEKRSLAFGSIPNVRDDNKKIEKRGMPRLNFNAKFKL